MTDTTIPYHLTIPTLISLTALILVFMRRKSLFKDSNSKLVWTSVTIFFVLYTAIVGLALYTDIYYQIDLYTYDLDKDGFFSSDEITKDQETAMTRLTNDTGRNFAPLTGLIFATLISLPIYFGGLLIEKVRAKRLRRNTV